MNVDDDWHSFVDAKKIEELNNERTKKLETVLEILNAFFNKRKCDKPQRVLT